MKRAIFSILAVAAILTTALAGCSPAAAPATNTAAPAAPTNTAAPAPTTAPTQAPKTGGQVIVGHGQEPDRFWGPFTGLTVAQEVGGLMNLPLVIIDNKLNLAPRLVTQVPTTDNGDISADGLTITFRLRDDVKWHDGEPLTSADVKFTYEVMMMEGTDVKGRAGWDRITEVQTPDDYTAVFTFASIDSAFLNRISLVGILPEHILGGKSAADINQDPWFRAPVGTGPFMFKEWVAGDHITVVKNPNYFEDGKPTLDTIIWKVVPDANALINQLQTGDVDIALRLNNTFAATIDDFDNVTRISSSTVTPWVIWVNNDQPGLDDPAVRQALSYALDRDGISSQILKGLVQPAYGYLPPDSWAFNPNAMQFHFDLDKANQVLDDAGWVMGSDGIREKDGVKLSYKIINIAGEQERVTILTAVAANWKKIGVNAEIELVDVAKMWGDQLPNHTFELGYSYSGMTADPDISNMFFCPENKPTTNFAGYCDPQVDEYIKAELSTFDLAKRKDALWKAQEIIAEAVPYLFLNWRADHTGVNERVQGYLPCPGYIEMWNAQDWSMTQ